MKGEDFVTDYNAAISDPSVMVMLIDDQAIVGEAIRRLLVGESDMDMHYCADPMEAIEVVNQIKPTVILLDLVMPQMDGLDVLRLLRSSPVTTNVPVVLLSTTEDPQVKSQAFAAGANDYMVKLPSQVELVARIRYHSKSYLNLVQRDDAYRALRESQQQLLDSNTALKALNEAFLEAKEEADKANAAKSEFLSRMSHELRTPLNAVLGFAQVLEMEPLNALQVRSVENILKGGRHLLDLINEVLDIARIEAGRLSLSLEPVRLGDLLDEALEFMRPLAEHRGIRLNGGQAGDENYCGEHFIMTDRQRCKQVILNLLSNAIKYNRESGQVTIFCDAGSNGRLRLNVRDTGPGIPAEKMEQLFLPFERLGAEHSEVEGTGIGLALCKRLVEAMGGDILAKSTVGEGSIFSVEFPYAIEAGAEYSIQQEDEDNVIDSEFDAGIELSILYIEDNLSNLQLIETIISYWPRVRLIASMQGSMGIDLAREQHPDVILLDLHLPDMNGAEVLQRLREEEELREIPVVILSADATLGQTERLLKAGAREYLAKPVDVKRFRQMLREIYAEKSAKTFDE